MVGTAVGLGVALGVALGVGVSPASGVATGVGAADALGTGVGAGYLLLMSSAGLRVMSHAIRTPEAPRTRTIANTHGHGPLRDSPRMPSPPTGGGAI